MSVIARMLGEQRAKWTTSGHPRDPVVASILGLQQNTKAKIAVDEDSALRFSAVFACVRVISEDVAKLPLILYRRLDPRGKERAQKHPSTTCCTTLRTAIWGVSTSARRCWAGP